MDPDLTGTDTGSPEPPQWFVNATAWTLAAGLASTLAWIVWWALW